MVFVKKMLTWNLFKKSGDKMPEKILKTVFLLKK